VREPSHSGARTRRGGRALVLSAAGALALLAAGADIDAARAALPQQAGRADLVSDVQLRIDGAIGGGRASAAVAGAGDVNGDGRGDVVVGAPQETARGRSGSGSAYVIFGTESPTTVDLAQVGARGFRIDGAADGDRLGTAVGGAGDVNGDGLADVVLGAPDADAHGRGGSGTAFVVFGRRETPAAVDLAALGGAGFRIDGAAALDNAGAAVAGAGDVNGDGRADVVVGAPQAGNNARPGSGSAHVLIGFGTPRVAYRELVAAAGVPMAPLTPTVERTGPARFAVSPALPEGLSLDAATGVISGMPTTARPRRAHTVTMTDLAGTAQNALVITVTRSAGRRSGVCGVVPRRERPPFTPGTVTLSARQLRINQRIAQAAVRRVNAVQAWLDARVDGGDICGLSLTAAKFGPGIVLGPGPTAPASDAFPRPFREKRPPRSEGARVVLSARQLRVSQRISQAAMRRAKGLSRRLGRGLTGGDIRRGTITRDVLAPGLAIVAATPVPNPPRPSRTVIRAPRARKPARFELSAAQLLTNQRIAQAALRRATVLRDELRAGLTAEDFRNRTITAVNLAPALIASAGARRAVP
jgi:FG-GAP repeat/Putative Ig domain